MAFRTIPKKDYRLRDGSLGTYYEALTEALKVLEAQRQSLDERIEILRAKIETAEGHP